MTDGLDHSLDSMSLQHVSPLDGRYAHEGAEVARHFSELALMRYRFVVEVEWLVMQSELPELTHVRTLDEGEHRQLREWVDGFSAADAERIKQLESETNHDVKAVEYFLKEQVDQTSMADIREAVHFSCTSEDINNLAYGLMLKEGVASEWEPPARALVDAVAALAQETRDLSLLTRTHGQPATPSTLGKELAVFVLRWHRQLRQIAAIEYLGKFNGAVGSYNAHAAAYPDVDWPEISRAFVERLGLIWNPLTTQIEPHDYMAELFHAIVRFNNVLLDFDLDMWAYIGLGYIKQRVVEHEVGSSTMPHKVNPIQFENSEANIGLSNALLTHLASKLAVSRLQRDLSDSSALRNVGVALGHSRLAIRSALAGVLTAEADEPAMLADLEDAWEVLGEAIQTLMRKAGCRNPYEQLKRLTRGASITQAELVEVISQVDITADDRDQLLALTPRDYTGLANKLLAWMPESPAGDG
jgi:adenylosuccinate lyase